MRLWHSILAFCATLVIGCTGPTEPPPTSIKPLDTARVTAARVNLNNDPELGPCAIQVSAENDLLVMKGNVPSEEGKKRAETLVRKVEGIEKVANHLMVTPSMAQTPTE